MAGHYVFNDNYFVDGSIKKGFEGPVSWYEVVMLRP